MALPRWILQLDGQARVEAIEAFGAYEFARAEAKQARENAIEDAHSNYKTAIHVARKAYEHVREGVTSE